LNEEKDWKRGKVWGRRRGIGKRRGKERKISEKAVGIRNGYG
jgi:hypothetical protein